MSFDRNKSLEELEGIKLESPDFGSSLVQRAHQLYRQPLVAFTVEDLRLMIGQDIGLEFLVPLAIEVLEDNPLAGGDYHFGDLLLAVLRVKKDFWSVHQDLRRRVYELTAGLAGILDELKQSVDKFQAQGC